MILVGGGESSNENHFKKKWLIWNDALEIWNILSWLDPRVAGKESFKSFWDVSDKVPWMNQESLAFVIGPSPSVDHYQYALKEETCWPFLRSGMQRWLAEFTTRTLNIKAGREIILIDSSSLFLQSIALMQSTVFEKKYWLPNSAEDKRLMEFLQLKEFSFLLELMDHFHRVILMSFSKKFSRLHSLISFRFSWIIASFLTVSFNAFWSSYSPISFRFFWISWYLLAFLW